MTFICGRAGICAIGAVAAKRAGDEQLLSYYLGEFNEVKRIISPLKLVIFLVPGF